MKKNDNDQRLITAVLLSLAVYWVWTLMFAPRKPVGQQPQPQAQAAQQQAPTQPQVAPPVQPPAAPPAAEDRDLPVVELPFQSETVRAVFTSEGGALSDLELAGQDGAYEVQPIWRNLLQRLKGRGSKAWMPYGEDPGPERLVGPSGALVAAGIGSGLDHGRYEVSHEGREWVARRVTPEGLEITKVFGADADPRFIDVRVGFRNTGATTFQGTAWVGAADDFHGKASRYTNIPRPVAVAGGDLETLSRMSSASPAPKVLEGATSWFGIADRYFLAAVIPEDPAWNRAEFRSDGQVRGMVAAVRSVELEPGQELASSFRVYVGSKAIGELSGLGSDLDQAVNFGIFGFFSRILLWILQRFHDVVPSWGVSIILLTLLMKLAFWPLTRKSFSSGRKMQQLSPRVQEIKEKYKDEPQKASEAQMRLFREEGVNPLSGCLPMLIQMPVWFALYSVLLFTADFYHEGFLYIRDLSSADPYGLLPTLVGVLMLLQQRLTPTSPSMDQTQQRIMRLMPLVFVFVMYSFPSGLALYILVNTMLSILQMYLINRAFPVATNAAPAR